jgi:hypothetical protein
MGKKQENPLSQAVLIQVVRPDVSVVEVTLDNDIAMLHQLGVMKHHRVDPDGQDVGKKDG